MTYPTPKRRRFRHLQTHELYLLIDGLGLGPSTEASLGLHEELADEVAMRDRWEHCETHSMEPQLVGGGFNMWSCVKCGFPGHTQEDFNRAAYGSL